MKNKKAVFFILGVIVFLNIVLWLVVWDLSKTKPFEVVFFDVGQGDSIFIETPARQQILIDGGPSSVILKKLAKEMPFYDRTIDLIILTHPEHDHLFGLIEVLKKYKVNNILWTGVKRDTPEWKEWNKLIKEEGANIEIAQAGEKVILSKSFIRVLYPLDDLEGQEFKTFNNTSIVCKLVFNKISFLFTGDIEGSTEEKLVENHSDLNANVLKVAHHGSKTSSEPEFLKKVSPQVAVISVGGNNRYGHPHPLTLANLKKFAIQVLRTDRDGDIRIFSDGENLKVQNVK